MGAVVNVCGGDVDCERDLFPRYEPGPLDAFHEQAERRLGLRQRRPESPSAAFSVDRPRARSTAAVTLRTAEAHSSACRNDVAPTGTTRKS
jgi:hypothetical protein